VGAAGIGASVVGFVWSLVTLQFGVSMTISLVLLLLTAWQAGLQPATLAPTLSRA